MFHHPARAVATHCAVNQPRELPKFNSTQPRLATRWNTLYCVWMFGNGEMVKVRAKAFSAHLPPLIELTSTHRVTFSRFSEDNSNCSMKMS